MLPQAFLNIASTMIQTCVLIVRMLFDSYLPLVICCSLVTHMLFISPGAKAMKSSALKLCIPPYVRRHHPHIVHRLSAYELPPPDLPMNELKDAGSTCQGVATRARRALQVLIKGSQSQLPATFIDHIENVEFLRGPNGDMVCFPCPLQEQEAASALKALEGAAVAAIADLIEQKPSRRSIEVHLDRVTCFLMSTYMVTINDRSKYHLDVKELVRDTDYNEAQSILYRRLSANLYKTSEPGKYYHIHGSLDASTTLELLNLPTHMPQLSNYRDCLNMIGGAVQRFSTAELEARNAKYRQAGAPALTKEEFLNTPHGKVMKSLPPFTVQRIVGSATEPVAFPAACSTADKPKQILQGIKVLELCRVIAGPTIGRSLAALGASVLKINSPNLPDVTFFQVDVNTGKHTAWLDLQDPDDRAVFESLIDEADVVIDGYRPGILAKFGCDPEVLAARAARRGRGIVYVAEDCFGGTGAGEPDAAAAAAAEWAHRPGWQQIADCVTGVAWEQGRFMGLDEPVVPPFPMSDYGTGCLGSVAALAGLHRRATEGGSWVCRTSLLQYDLFLLSLGRYDDEILRALRAAHDQRFFDLRHDDSVDVVSAAALESMRRLHPALFDEARMMHRAPTSGFRTSPPPSPSPSPTPASKMTATAAAAAAAATTSAEARVAARPKASSGKERQQHAAATVTVTWPREAVEVEGWKIGHVRPSRANGADRPAWGDWERDESLLGA